MKYYFIVNPGSRTGKGKGLWESLEAKIKASGVEYEVLLTKKAGDATEYAAKICEEHPEMKRIIMVGGDGTANESINGLENYSNFELGYVPTGSSNDLARGLGISQDSEAELDRVLAPKQTRSLDHGVVEFLDDSENDPYVVNNDRRNYRKFFCGSGIGYNADICYDAQLSRLKGFLNKIGQGKLIYYLLGIKLIFARRRASASILIDGERRLNYNEMLFADAMNTQYEGGGMPMGPGADPGDGKLTICVVHDISVLKHMMLMTSIIKGNHIKHKGVELITCESMEIEVDRPLVVHTDGEYAGKHRKIRFSCLPEKAKMIL